MSIGTEPRRFRQHIQSGKQPSSPIHAPEVISTKPPDIRQFQRQKRAYRGKTGDRRGLGIGRGLDDASKPKRLEIREKGQYPYRG